MASWIPPELEAMQPVTIPYILIVESDPDIAALLQRMIKSELHMGTLFATTMKDAARVTHVLKPLLFLINERLFDGNGFSLYETLRRRAGFESIPTLILSTVPCRCQPRVGQRHLSYLEIPFELDDLLGILTPLLSLPVASVAGKTTHEVLQDPHNG